MPSITEASTQGPRLSFEDAHIIARVDGFNRLDVAVRERLLVEAFQLLQSGQERDLPGNPSGTTGIGIIIAEKKVYGVSIGDSTCFSIIRNKNGHLIDFKRINPLHHPNIPNERARIEAAGGFVKEDRLNGILAVSRNIGGMHELKGLSHEPEPIPSFDVPPLNPGEKHYLILACDGLTEPDVILAKQQQAQIDPVEGYPLLKNWLLKTIHAEELMHAALENGSKDNISVIVIDTLSEPSDHALMACVFDGHGGAATASYCQQKIHVIIETLCKQYIRT